MLKRGEDHDSCDEKVADGVYMSLDLVASHVASIKGTCRRYKSLMGLEAFMIIIDPMRVTCKRDTQ